MQVNKSGFTLVELMIVIAIIGVLAASLFPIMSGYMAKARDTTRVANLKALETAIFQATNDKGGYLFSDIWNAYWCSTIGSYWRTSFEDRVSAYLTKVPHDPLYTSPVPLSDTGATVDYFYGEGFTITGLTVGTNGGISQFVLGAHFESTPPKDFTGATWMVWGCYLGPDGTYPSISLPYNGLREKKF